jgi:alanine dehydrogenase
MNIGIPKEKRPFEFRVGMTPAGVEMLCQAGHMCYIEHDAGLGAGFSDQDYVEAGGRIAYSPHEVFARADLLLKVARPLYEELEWLRPATTIAGLLHLGSTRKNKIDLMREKGITAIAYENITLPDGMYPVRRPLSQIGGRLAAQIAARLMQNDRGGKGILLGGEAGIPPAEVVIIGAGVAGTGALRAFLGMGAHITILDNDLNVLQRVYDDFPCVVTMLSYPRNIQRACAYADIVVGAILVPGGPPPKIITREIVRTMKPRSLIMDISIDEGGCVETSRPTNHEYPTFVEEGVVHYCVPNIPSVVARTSTYAFLNAAFPYILELANRGVERAVAENPAIERGAAVYEGELRHIAQIQSEVEAEPHGTE